MPVFRIEAPDLGFGFRWEPESKNLFVIHISSGVTYEQIASNIMTPEAAAALTRMWCKGYRSRMREVERAPGLNHRHMFAESGKFGVGSRKGPPVVVSETK